MSLFCGKHNGCQGFKCTNCGTLGCTNGTCKHGEQEKIVWFVKKRKLKLEYKFTYVC